MPSFETPTGSVELKQEKVIVHEPIVTRAKRTLIGDKIVGGGVFIAVTYILWKLASPETRPTGLGMVVASVVGLALALIILRLRLYLSTHSAAKVINRQTIQHVEYHPGSRFQPAQLAFVFENGADQLYRHAWRALPWWDESEKLEQALDVLEVEGIEIREMD
jgi:hypothetical protein